MNFDVYRGKRVFVTGHTGFKGSWLCEWLLALGAEVHGYALKPPTKPALFNQLKLAKRITSHVIGDVRDLAALTKAVKAARPDFIFHLAAQPLVRESYAKPVETFETNVMGTVNLLEAVRKWKCEEAKKCEVRSAKCEVRSAKCEVRSAKCEVRSAKCEQWSEESSSVGTSPLALGPISPCSVVCITTDKCYENKETARPYREDDPMGGYDPYSCSKGCDELVIASYRRSFFNAPESPVWVASARAGNVIGGGDWAKDRIVPDAMRAWLLGKCQVPSAKCQVSSAKCEVPSAKCEVPSAKCEQWNDNNSVVGASHFALRSKNASSVLTVRNSRSTRPWQHVLEPLSGYLTLGAALGARRDFAKVAGGFNFGPDPSANRTVKEVVEELLKHMKGTWADRSDPKAVHEAGLLNLDIRKAKKVLGWAPRWGFEETIAKVAAWYVGVADGEKAQEMTQRQIQEFVGQSPDAEDNI